MAVLKAEDMGALISDSYNPRTKVLDLSNQMKAKDLVYVLAAVRSSPFFNEIQSLILKNNEFDNSENLRFGDVDIGIKTMLPPKLKLLDLSNNQLYDSSAILNILPKELEVLYLSNNLFEGSFNWISLPNKLRGLDLSGNNGLDDAMDWTVLPASLKTVRMPKSKLKGSMKWDRDDYENKSLFSRREFELVPIVRNVVGVGMIGFVASIISMGIIAAFITSFRKMLIA